VQFRSIIALGVRHEFERPPGEATSFALQQVTVTGHSLERCPPARDVAGGAVSLSNQPRPAVLCVRLIDLSRMIERKLARFQIVQCCTFHLLKCAGLDLAYALG
jgi:hypothetical protein